MHIKKLPPAYFNNILQRHYSKLLILTGILCFILAKLHYPAIGFFRIALFALGVYLCVRSYGFPQWRFLKFLGLLSLNIYLVHGEILVRLPREWTGAVAYAVVLACSISLAFLMYKVRCWFTERKKQSVESKKIG